jgi:hypothetical protein
MTRKLDLLKSCGYCGQAIPRVRCTGKAMRNRQSEKCACRNARVDAGNAGLLKPACEVCGGCFRLHLHHNDKNRENNTAGNVRTLCGSCHAKWHWSHGWKSKPRATCSICGGPVKGLGFCQKHFRRFRKYGNPLLVQIARKLQRVSPSYSRNVSLDGTNHGFVSSEMVGSYPSLC